MKIAVFAALLSVASAMAQQYLLPIGSNVNNRQSEVSIVISALDTWARLEDTFSFYPYMGDFEDVIKNRVKVLAERYVPPLGFEQGEFALNVQATPGPYSQNIFRLQQSDGKWAVPPEVLDVKLQYGEVTLRLTGVTRVELRVRGNGREERFSSDGSSPGSTCFIQTVDRELGQGLVILAKEYVNPQYREAWITEGEVILWENERLAMFNILDGIFFSASANTPKLLESLKAPDIPQAPVLVVNTPRISKIARIGNTTEITVSVEATSVANIEFSESIGGIWNAIPAYQVPLQLQTGSNKFTHSTEALTSFYRVRLVQTE